jgi:hypothetical protein
MQRKPWHWDENLCGGAFCKALRQVRVHFGCDTRRDGKKRKKSKKNEGGEDALRRPPSALAISAAREVRFDATNVDSFGNVGFLVVSDCAIGVDTADFVRTSSSRLELCRFMN